MICPKIISITTILTAFTLAAFVPAANAGEPGRKIFQQCSSQLEVIVNRADANLAAQVSASSRTIRNLMKRSLFKQAAREAMISVGELVKTTDTYLNYVSDLRDSCLSRLQKHGAHKLYREFSQAADDAQYQIKESLGESIGQINALMLGVH